MLPIVIILVIGATVRNTGELRIAVVTTEQSTLVTDLRQSPAVEVTEYTDESTARNALRRNELDAVVLIPPGLEAMLRSGASVTIPVLGGAAPSTRQAALSAVSGAVARQAARVEAERFTVAKFGGSLDERLDAVTRLQNSLNAVTVRSETVDAAIIQSRRLGIYERATAAPVRTRDNGAWESNTYSRQCRHASLNSGELGSTRNSAAGHDSRAGCVTPAADASGIEFDYSSLVLTLEHGLRQRGITARRWRRRSVWWRCSTTCTFSVSGALHRSALDWLRISSASMLCARMIPGASSCGGRYTSGIGRVAIATYVSASTPLASRRETVPSHATPVRLPSRASRDAL